MIARGGGGTFSACRKLFSRQLHLQDFFIFVRPPHECFFFRGGGGGGGGGIGGENILLP